jgi:tRNA nucleotidyltransferase (CCA-adding enzyme)
MEIFEVGGAVRDCLLGQPVTERDWVVVGAGPEDLQRLGYRPVGKDFPVFLHPQSKEQYALARTERKIAPGHGGFAFNTSPDVTLEEDLQRRDLTINAMAKDARGRIIDPYGGRRDLAARKLRHVSAAFGEDPLRVLRTARFAARFAPLGFAVAPETLELMRTMTAGGELDALSPDRVWQETEKGLATPQPDVFFRILRECGALERVFPEVAALFGVPQPARWHPEIDTGVHTLMALAVAAGLSDEPCVRFAVLVHDLGKATTPQHLLPSHHGHGERSVGLIEELSRRLPVPRRFRQLAVIVARLHGLTHRADELRPSKVLALLDAADGFRQPARFERFLLACEADARGRGGLTEQPYPQGQTLRRALRAALAADTAPLRERGLTGEALGDAIRELRQGAITAALRG